jgi:transposase
MEPILAAVRTAPAVHVDETGWRQGGTEAWPWVAATGGATAFPIHRSRGAQALGAPLGQGPGEGRVLISDRSPTSARAPNRQVCRAHLRRDFTAMIDRASGGEAVGRRLLEQSRRTYAWWERSCGGSSSRATLRASVAGPRRPVEYLLRQGVGCPCRWTATVCRSPLEAGPHLWAFAAAEGVPADDNAAERALRHGVIRREPSPGTASASGGRFVERMLSVVATCRRRGRDVLAYLTACVRSGLGGAPAPGPLA